MTHKAKQISWGDHLAIEELVNGASLDRTKDNILIFWASRDEETGEMWCPDCRKNEPLVQAALEDDAAPPTTIIYVGPRTVWKNNPSHPFRQAPFFVEGVPSVFRVKVTTEPGATFESQITRASKTKLVEDDANDPQQLRRLFASA